MPAPKVKLDATTIAAIGTAISVILGGAELRMKVGDIDARLGRLERIVEARSYSAHNESDDE